MLGVVSLSVLAALLFASAATLQQLAARRAALRRASELPEIPGLAESNGGALYRFSLLRHLGPRAVRLIGGLLRERLWLAGWACNICGFLTQAAALHFGSLSVVQPLLVTQLLFALVFSSMLVARNPRAIDLMAGAAICGGLALLLSVHGAVSDSDTPDRPRVALALLCALVLAALLAAAATTSGPSARAATLGIAAGQFFALSAALITLTTDDLLHRGVGATALDWPGYALALTTLVGLLLEQSAFASGPLPSALTAMTIVNPVASYLLGILAVGVAAPAGAGAITAVGVSASLLVVGIVTIAHSPSTRAYPEVPGQPAPEALLATPAQR